MRHDDMNLDLDETEGGETGETGESATKENEDDADTEEDSYSDDDMA